MSGSWGSGGATELQRHAPLVAVALTGLVAAWPTRVDQHLFAGLRVVVAEALGLTPLRPVPAGPRRTPTGPPSLTVLGLAEQFAVDVARIEPVQREAWLVEVGPAAFDVAFSTYVADYVPRVRAVLRAVFGADTWFDPEPVRSPHARLILDEFLREVAMLDHLDPVTTELVRLRGARQHHCRVCMSRRSIAAVRAGADAGTFLDVDEYRGSDLTPRQQAALALTDAVIWTPGSLRERDLADVRAHLAPAEVVEVVLDVMRNAANKIAVALGADEPEVDGVQLFEVDQDGALSFP